MSDNKVVDIILHCQKQIKKERLPEEKLLHYLGRLSRLRVTVQDLADTGIGRTVNSLSRNEGPVGQAADTLVRGWKRMVSEQQSQAEKESESESNSGSSEEEEEEEEEEVNNAESEPYEIEEQEESHTEERRYSNGHAGYEGNPQTSHQGRGYQDPDDGDDDLNDDIDDPYMENGFLSMANVHSDGDDDDEEENDDKDLDSDGSERLEIDADEDDDHADPCTIDKATSFPVKQERQEEREQKSSHSTKSSSSSSSHRPHESDFKKQISSNSSSSKYYRDHERSGEKSQSKEHKHHHHSSSKSSSSKDRSKQNSGNNEQHSSSSSSSSHPKNHHHHSSSSSKSEKSKEKSDHVKSHHHKEKDKHHRSKDSNSSHRDRDKEKETKEKERSSKDKKESNDHRSSSSSNSSSHKSKLRDPTSMSSHSPKKSSLESNVKKESSSHDERKRKEHLTNSPCDSSTHKKAKLALKEEIDSNSGINFADVLGSLDVPSGSSSSKSSSTKKDKKKEDREKSHRKHHHESHHGSSTKKHDSPSSSKHSSSRDAGSSSSSSKKYDRGTTETSKVSKSTLPQSKIESVIQPIVNISPNYKPMSSSLTKVARVVSSGSANGIALPPPVPLSQSDLSDLGSVDFWDGSVTSGACEMSQEDAISTMLSSRNARSKVFSGAKTARRGEVASLFDLCMQVIKDNIGDLGYTGGIPYDILKPALERANPQQLISIESQNDYLIGETDELWQFHCKRDFRGKVPAETESWRELYERCTEERQQRFEVVKKKMKRTIEKAEPQRKAKLAYVDTTCTTRFNRQKAQTIKNGMKTLKIKEEKGPSRGVASSASAGFNNPKKSGDANNVVVEEAAVIIAPESRAGHAPAPSVSRESSAAKLKPKKAPLMAKTMKLIKSLHRR